MKGNTLFFTMNLLAIAGLAFYGWNQPKASKKGFILNQQAFTQFKGTKALETRLNQLKQQHQQQLDSVHTLPQRGDMTPLDEEINQRYALGEQALSEQYTTDIWKQINQYATEFGRENGYDFIFGATGNGNLMYARDTHNVTDEFIRYLNEKYEGNQ